jgi:phosphate transport system substrate-binding protein
MSALLRSLCLVVCALALPATAQTTVNVGGVGALSPLLLHLAGEFQRLRPDITVTVANPPLGTNGALRALAAGKLDIALLGREPRTEDKVVGRAWLRTPLVLVSSRADSAGLTRHDIADIYAGRKTAWADGRPIRLILRGPFESELIALRAASAEVDAAITTALTRPGLPVAENDLEALTLLTGAAGSLGTSTLGLLRISPQPLHILSLDGTMPSLAALESGRYPLQRSFYLASTSSPGKAAAAFLAHLTAPATLKGLRRFDYGPPRP